MSAMLAGCGGGAGGTSTESSSPPILPPDDDPQVEPPPPTTALLGKGFVSNIEVSSAGSLELVITLSAVDPGPCERVRVARADLASGSIGDRIFETMERTLSAAMLSSETLVEFTGVASECRFNSLELTTESPGGS